MITLNDDVTVAPRCFGADLSDTPPLMAQLAQYLYADVRDNFASESRSRRVAMGAAHASHA